MWPTGWTYCASCLVDVQVPFVLVFSFIGTDIFLSYHVFSLLNPFIRPFMLMELFQLHSGMQNHLDAVDRWVISQGVVVIHFLLSQPHHHSNSRMILLVGPRVKAVGQLVHGRYYRSYTSRVLRERYKEMPVLFCSNVLSNYHLWNRHWPIWYPRHLRRDLHFLNENILSFF